VNEGVLTDPIVDKQPGAILPSRSMVDPAFESHCLLQATASCGHEGPLLRTEQSVGVVPVTRRAKNYEVSWRAIPAARDEMEMVEFMAEQRYCA
jgi:hypothetical protein